MKVFVSLPMADKPIERIKVEQLDIFLRFVYDKPAWEYELIDSVLPDESDYESNHSVWCLGRSVQLMADADLVIFARDWRDARGCRVEHSVCELYKIPHLYDGLNEGADD